jgi:hypothetical protein
LVQRTTAQSSFDQSEPSVVPFKQLFRMQAIIETFIGSEKIRQLSEFFAPIPAATESSEVIRYCFRLLAASAEDLDRLPAV